MAPRISNPNLQKKQKDITLLEMKKFKKNLQNLRKFVEKNFEYVDHNFANKVREVYYDKKSKKIFLELLQMRKGKN